MVDGTRSRTFWKTLPGVLTAIAGLITAVGGMIAVLLQIGIIGGAENKTAPPPVAQTLNDTPTTNPVAITTATATTTEVPVGKPWSEVEAVITAKDGTVTRMRAETVRYCFSGGMGVNLNESQDVPFEKMTKLEVLRSDVALSAGGRADVRITLTSGSTLTGTVSSGCEFAGQTELGRFSLYSDRLSKIEFLR